MQVSAVRRPGGGPRPILALRRPSERVLYGLIGFLVVLPLWEAVVRLGLVRRVSLSAPSYIL